MRKAHIGYSEAILANITKIPLDLLFIVDATGSMGSAITKVKKEIIYISVKLIEKEDMKDYELSLAAIFYRNPIDGDMIFMKPLISIKML